ncbi:CENP-S associating centromere protein X-domain-containing protein [Macrophomina phaseolina]|uniref:CENP-S associating centromere protein X-domain-containing protein n=1 Tax=Macrophomina phaseolina TaxID=35725 RepID=A0ABQ8G4D2_9PEZI|nr:CENP-S associating centromere protein X-domain-containing protein [Macrophomina phaseolina]
MPPVRTGSKNTAFKPPRRISDKSDNSDLGGPSRGTAPRPARVPASKTSAAPGPSSASRATTALKPAAATVAISDSDLDDLDDGLLDDDDDDDDEDTSRRRSTNAPAQDASLTDAAAPSASQDAEDQPPIPPKLLNRLLHEGFEDEDMRIGKEAMAVASKYVETFVREALARAMYEREEADREQGGAGDGFLQVEDLEKLAPQLLLDF